MPSGDSADALREVWMEGYNRGLGESGRKSAQRADEAQDEVARLARENAALRQRVEELERDIRVHDTRRWLSSCTPAERSEVAFYADIEGFKARAEKAERERTAALESLASYQAASHNYVRCYELNRQLQADLDAALVLCVASDWDVEVLGAGYEFAVYKAHAHVLPLLEKRREENRG